MPQSGELRRRPGPPFDRRAAGRLGGSEILELIGVDDFALESSGGDAGLLDTLTITFDFLVTLGEANVLETFLRLPRSDQADFLRWIAMTDGPEVREMRARTFVSALAEAPLTGTERIDRDRLP